MRIRALVFLAALSGFAAARPAVAESRTHDGMMVQMELGVGYLHMPGTTEGGARSVDTSITGGNIAGGLLLGSTLWKGVVIGAATQNHSVWSPQLKSDAPTEELDGSLGLSVMGVFVQYYPDPKDGLFFRLMPGYSLVYATDSAVESFATGPGLAAAAGYDWWIGDEWSMGVAGRLAYANVKYDTQVEELTIQQRYHALAPSVLLTLTHH